MSLTRNVATIGSGTLVSRLLGFLRDMGIAALLGASVLSDAYFTALQVPNLFRRLLAEGALNSAFVPMWLRRRDEEGPEGAKRFGEDILGPMLVGLGTLALLCIVFAPVVVRLLAPGFDPGGQRYALAVGYVRLSIFYVAAAGLVSVAASVLNAEGRVTAVALGIVMFNAVFLVVVLALLASGAGAAPQTGTVLSIAVVLSGLGQLVIVGGALFRLKHAPLRPRFRWSPNATRFFSLAIPGVLAGGIPQLKLMVGAIIASSSQSSVSWLYYANRLYELPLGVVSITVAAVMGPLIAAGVRSGKHDEIALAQSRSFEIALGLALPAAIAFAILAEPIAGGLFERGAFGPRDTAAVAAALAAISAGLPGHVLEKVFGAVSFAHEDTRTPMLAALAGLAAAAILGFVLFPHYGHVGVAAAIALSGWMGATILLVVLIRRGWLRLDHSARWRLPLILLAALVMGAAILLAQYFVATHLDMRATATVRALVLAGLVGIGLAIYFALLHAFGVFRIREMAAAFRRRA